MCNHISRLISALTCFLALALCACASATGGQVHDEMQMQEPAPVVEEGLTKKALDEYSWEELSQISKLIASAPSDEEGREVAKTYGLVGDDGSITDQTKRVFVSDARAVNGDRVMDVRLAGIRHDDRADGSGKAGLTFMTVGALDIRPMNDGDTVAGGWEGSTLRAWLNSEAVGMFDSDFVDALVEVNKPTNNTGFTEMVESVTNTPDRLWVFSVREVCGDVHWDIEEYQQKRGYQEVDGVLNAEGAQYEVFAKAGVNGNGSSSEVLSLENTTGASPTWYRSPYPFEYLGYVTGSPGYFCRITASGYPESLGFPSDPSSVVVGFCV
ncbi:MAG: DUF6273 domain-containing protein [Atopobiaceae bacterium]|nr:DUF6273 domain-containing protein [Atopobiaceae bacterium]